MGEWVFDEKKAYQEDALVAWWPMCYPGGALTGLRQCQRGAWKPLGQDMESCESQKVTFLGSRELRGIKAGRTRASMLWDM